ncbi:hypothetical protein O181_090449 [Austropuccinia psidii MF-1]|uniref:Uncharacterized protein n=1 Tax=Austropuccinia psidii MF-1 TaxID=1389203 RepID=A0A9Q3IVM3_9BASI|nr:hypothetical protein [Austropuccinia psidii MF-1]
MISIGAIMKPNYQILTHKNQPLKLFYHNNKIIILQTFNAESFEVSTERHQALTSLKHLNSTLSLHQAAGHPCEEYFNIMFPTYDSQPSTSVKLLNNLSKAFHQHLNDIHNLFTPPIWSSQNPVNFLV